MYFPAPFESFTTTEEIIVPKDEEISGLIANYLNQNPTPSYQDYIIYLVTNNNQFPNVVQLAAYNFFVAQKTTNSGGTISPATVLNYIRAHM